MRSTFIFPESHPFAKINEQLADTLYTLGSSSTNRRVDMQHLSKQVVSEVF